MSGLRRFTEILRLFGEKESDWTVQEMSDRIGVPASTVYRTVRELVDAGFLEPSREAHYRLGAAFVEFDRLIRLTDPLVKAGKGLLKEIALHTSIPCVAVLARLYGDRVICAADELGNGSSIRTSYEQGRPMPLVRGATSKTILAQLPTRRLNKLLSRVGTDTSDLSGPSAQRFREELSTIRKRGFCITRGEVDEGLVGIAVPVACPELAIVASLSLVVQAATLTGDIEQRLVLLLVPAAGLLTEALRKQTVTELSQAGARHGAR